MSPANYINIFLTVKTLNFAVATMFGGVERTWMREAEEHTGIGARHKASNLIC